MTTDRAGPTGSRRGAVSAGPAVMVLAVIAMLLGCSTDDAEQGSSPRREDGGPAVDEVAIGAASFADVQCPEGVTAAEPVTVSCGTLTVPEHHEEPGGPTVVLPVAILEPPGGPSEPDPVVYLDGGPGGDGVTFAEGLSHLPIAQTRRVVVIGQRGTPLAEPSFDCPEIEALDVELYGEALDTPESNAEADDALAACFERVAAGQPAFDTYDSATAADDLEAARRALGYGEWNLYGISYGTRLALEVVRRHPEAVRSVTLDSVYPTDADGYASVIPNAERGFGQLAEACGEDRACTAAYPDLLGRLADLYDELEADPHDATVAHPGTGRPVTVRWDGDRTVAAAYLALYDAALVPLLPSLLVSFENGEFDLATTTYLQLLESAADTVAEGLYPAVECRERAPFADTEEIARQEREEPNWLQASVGDFVGEDLSDCDLWMAPPSGPEVVEPVRGDIPTLVLAGRFDPVTPPDWGRQVADAQERAWFYEMPASGHAVSTETCAADIVQSFVDDPGTEPDTACIAELGPPAWVLPPAP